MDYKIARRKMVESQVRPNDVTDEALVEAFATVPREAFLPKSKQPLAYSELEIPTVEGRAYWCARDLSKMLQALELKKTDLALVVASAEGYAAALISNLVDTVIALEENETVSEQSGEKLLELGYDRVACVSGPVTAGYPGEGPFDVIFVNGLVEQVPEALLSQLKPGGRLGAVVGTTHSATAMVYTSTGQTVSHRSIFDCIPPKLVEFDKEAEFNF